MVPFNPLDPLKAVNVNPWVGNKIYDSGPYIKPGTELTVKIDSREMELAILAAYDYGLDSLSLAGKHEINKLLYDLKVAITGR